MDNLERTSPTPANPMRRKDDQIFTRNVEIKGISDEDKQEIYENIDRIVENNRIPITDELLALKPKKKGAAFPITINILAITSVAAALFLSSMFFEQRQQALSLETQQYLSAEGKLIEQLKKESEEKLKAKDEEIGKIQDELAELDKKSADLQANMENTIREREEELRAELEDALDAERVRLQQIGASAEDIEARLAEFEQERRSEFDSQLNTFRAEAQAEIQAKEKELEQARALNRDFLAQMNAEKAELESELNKREEELSAQFEAEKAALEQETSEARKKLAELAAKNENEQLVIDQITSGYIAIKNHMENENYAAALEGVAALETLLSDPSVISLSSLAKRREAESFLLETLRQDIEAKTYKEDIDTASLVKAAETLLGATEIAQRGAAAFEAGETDSAEDYYSRAIAAIPALNRAYTDLKTITESKRTATLSTGITGASGLLTEGNYNAAVEQYRSAILASEPANPELYEQAVRGIEEALSKQRATALAAKDREITALSKEQQEELSTLEAELNARISELEQMIEELNGIIAEKETALQQAEEILAITGEEYNVALEEMKLLHSEELAAKEEELAAKDETLAAKEEEMLELESTHSEELAQLEAQKVEEISRIESDYEARIATLEEQIEGLAADIKASGDEIAGLQAVKTVYEELTADYLTYKSKIEQLLSTDKRDEYRQAQSIYDDFLADEANTMFPGLNGITKDLTDIIVRDTKRDAVSEGRESALEDIQLYTGYLSGGRAAASSEIKEEISKLVREEPEYGDTILEIQQLLEAAGAEAAGSDNTIFRQTRFIGTISYITGDKIVIERLISFEAETGATILIKRKTRSGSDETLAEATISRITPQKVEAQIVKLSGDTQPQVMDMVYLVSE